MEFVLGICTLNFASCFDNVRKSFWTRASLFCALLERYQPIFRPNLCYIRSTLGSNLLFFFLNGGSMNRRLAATAILVAAFSLLGCGRKDAPLAGAQQATVSQDMALAKAALTAYVVDF